MIDRRTDDLPRYLSAEYETVIEPDDCGEEGPCFLARHPELRGCMSHGATAAEAIANLHEARALYFRTLLENGITPPLPAQAAVGAGVAPSTKVG
jgi:predicted RNase H-like HicB family nuclease